MSTNTYRVFWNDGTHTDRGYYLDAPADGYDHACFLAGQVATEGQTYVGVQQIGDSSGTDQSQSPMP